MKKTWTMFLLLAMAACTSVDTSSEGAPGVRRSSSVIELIGEKYFPDSVAACKDGTLFVGSMGTGQIDRIPNHEVRPVAFVPPEAEQRTALGLLVDEDAGRLWACYRVPIENDGGAGVVRRIAVADTAANLGYDGMAALDADTLLAAEYNTGRLVMINITGNTGTKETVSEGLDFPTNLAVVGDGVWVVESQINHMLYADQAGPPQVPFRLKHVSLSSH